jgi:hypothetical protein
MILHESNHMPEWVRWMAQDADGKWWGYEIEPQQHYSGWYENELGRSIQLKTDHPNPEWKNTLTSVGQR